MPTSELTAFQGSIPDGARLRQIGYTLLVLGIARWVIHRVNGWETYPGGKIKQEKKIEKSPGERPT
jgi:hypothetical protein